MSADRDFVVPDLAGRKVFHVIGAGGANMNTIATVLAAMGHTVSGSDLHWSPVLERLEAQGARIFVGHCAGNVGDVDAVTFSPAVKPGNEELAEAKAKGVPAYSRAEMLAAICAAKNTLAVSGTHGKTTTTAMLAQILVEAGLSPSYMVGGELARGKGAACWQAGDWLVVEADESDGTFLRIPAHGVLVTSVEPDHLDHYGDFASLEAAFEQFLSQAGGPRIVCGDDPACRRFGARSAALMTYGTASGADFEVRDVELLARSASFSVRSATGDLGRFELAVPGLHNVLDAAGALAMALSVGAGLEAARAGLAAFEGTGRRFELRGESNGVTFIDDYAHNPGKVRAALSTARLGSWRRVVAVFQPHRYTRTAALWRQLGEALVGADVVVVTDVYAAGEEPQPGISGMLVAQAARAARPDAQVEYVEGRDNLVSWLRGALVPGDLCLTIGAGDITTLPDELNAQ